MKKILSVSLLILSLTLFCAFMPNRNFVVSNAVISGWENKHTLITNVDINFDEISVEDINCIKFEIFDKGKFITSATSCGENLENLLKYCSTFWGETRGTYKNVKGIRTLTCKFKLRQNKQDNGYWERESFEFDDSIPQTLIVTICTNQRDYVTNN